MDTVNDIDDDLEEFDQMRRSKTVTLVVAGPNIGDSASDLFDDDLGSVEWLSKEQVAEDLSMEEYCTKNGLEIFHIQNQTVIAYTAEKKYKEYPEIEQKTWILIQWIIFKTAELLNPSFNGKINQYTVYENANFAKIPKIIMSDLFNHLHHIHVQLFIKSCYFANIDAIDQKLRKFSAAAEESGIDIIYGFTQGLSRTTQSQILREYMVTNKCLKQFESLAVCGYIRMENKNNLDIPICLTKMVTKYFNLQSLHLKIKCIIQDEMDNIFQVVNSNIYETVKTVNRCQEFFRIIQQYEESSFSQQYGVCSV